MWLDDDLIDSEALDWVASMDGRVLAICPDSEVGLTSAHMSAIDAWIAAG